MRLWGTVQTATEPYLSMSGTSMASPVVSGTIALMLQANPALTPNLVKAILQFTAESRDGYDTLTQGAGFLNTRGAVELAQSLAAGGSLPAGRRRRTAKGTARWSSHVIWGNHRVSGGQLSAAANAWRTDVIWGSGRHSRRSARRLGHRLRRRARRRIRTVSPSRGIPRRPRRRRPEPAARTSCGAPHATAPTASTSSGALSRERSRHDRLERQRSSRNPTTSLWSAPAIRRQSRILVTDAAHQ